MQKQTIFKTALILSLLVGQVFFGRAQNQLDDGRTTATKIADLLNRFPAPNAQAMETAMQQMEDLGENGISQMATMLQPGSNNENLEYALAGFAFYASESGKDQLARTAVQAYGKALDKLNDPESKHFLLTQLKWIAKEDAIPYIEPYLQDERLSGIASRILANIGSSSAERALILALGASENQARQLNFIEALGDFGSKEALAEITPFATSDNPAVQKVALYALANIADPASAKTFYAAAESAQFTFDASNASALYLRYIDNLGEKSQAKTAFKLARKLHKKTSAADHYHTKAGALGLMAKYNPDKSGKWLQEAASSDNFRYRGTALKLLSDEDLVSELDDWKKTLEKGSPEVKAAIIRRMGEVKDNSIAGAIVPYLQSEDEAVRMAAIPAVVNAGESLALENLLDKLPSASESETEAIVKALKSMDGDNVTAAYASRIPDASPENKVLLLKLLASRAAEDQVDVVLNAARSNSPEVKEAAMTALSSISTASDLDQLVSLLKETTDPANLEKIQDAIIVANAQKDDVLTETNWAMELLPELAGDKQMYLYKVLAKTGGNLALEKLQDIYENGNTAQRQAVVSALNQADDAKATGPLLHIARNSNNRAQIEAALMGYIRLVASVNSPDTQKVLMLRNSLNLAEEGETIKAALEQIGNYPTFQALLVAAAYQEKAAYQQSAARAVMKIVLNNDTIFGDKVREIVEKTIAVISGQDSQYYKTSLQKYLDEMPEGRGFYALFNGENLDGWKGVFSNPIQRATMSESAYKREQNKANEMMEKGWKAEDGLLVFLGEGQNIAATKDYGDFEMFVDWKITEDGDAGIYLRGTPQVQIWDPARTDVGAEVGSGGLYNNQKHPSKPLKLADNPVGEWNTFHIKMQGEKVTVYLNGELVVDEVTLENYWDREQSIFPEGQIELQAHGTYVAYRDIYIRELVGAPKFELSEAEKEEGFEVLFDGTHLDKWTGNKTDYVVDNGVLAIYPDRGGQGNLLTEKEYGDFEFRFSFKLTPGANNGLGIRTPMEGDAAYVGMELQILDDTAEIYSQLKPYQYHGSLYGVAAAEKGHQNPVGEWNEQRVIVKGDQIRVILNGTEILDVNIAEAKKDGTLDGREHPGLFREKGHIGFLGHGDIVYFKDIRVKEL
ncbi:HEAT repeat [Cyclobacterium lianum]|uniref:HEAT repeat n=1 Tax=Cyclobacterium lianum TaxID=388280 RepID=A0A1M7LKG9_9BACT|nr:family 16 glycoside hydrolase [Cyclobacterium lianum]SHM78673.1 HEAT repeat [Cyclobacterium lianum]